MMTATDIRQGNVIRVDGRICKVLSVEIRGTGKFGKTVHVKLKGLPDGNMHEKGIRAEEKVEDVDVQRVKMQYLYKSGDQLMFMNMSTFEEFGVPAKVVGRQEVFLKENLEIDVELIDGQPVSIGFPKIAELKVVSAPPATGGGDTTYKEVELENGLKILVPQFVREGEIVRVSVDDLSYLERVTTKSMKSAAPNPGVGA